METSPQEAIMGVCNMGGSRVQVQPGNSSATHGSSERELSVTKTSRALRTLAVTMVFLLFMIMRGLARCHSAKYLTAFISMEHSQQWQETVNSILQMGTLGTGVPCPSSYGQQAAQTLLTLPPSDLKGQATPELKAGRMTRPFLSSAFPSLKDLRRKNSTNSAVQILGFKYQIHHLLFRDVMIPRVASIHPFYSPFPGASDWDL